MKTITLGVIGEGERGGGGGGGARKRERKEGGLQSPESPLPPFFSLFLASPPPSPSPITSATRATMSQECNLQASCGSFSARNKPQ